MFTRFSVSAIIILSALVWGATLAFFGVEITWQYITPFSVTVAIVTATLTAFDKWLWRYLPFRWFHTVPDLVGAWTVELKTSFSTKTVTGSATVSQTFSSISLRLKTESSSSFLIADRLIRHSDGVCEVLGIYQSDPSIHLRGSQSEIHYGAFRYSVTGSPATEMSGHYWTDRNTSGSIRLARKI